MKLPERISEITLHNIYSDAGGFPYPLGFHPFTECASDEGDVLGLYWPVGMEDQPPLVAARWHDSWEITPIYSSLEQFLNEWAMVRKNEDWDVWRDVVLGSPKISTSPLSPFNLYSNAQKAIEQDEPHVAITALVKALTALPEYSAGSSLLYAQYRRVGDNDSAIRTALNSIVSPISFGWRDMAVVRWLQLQESCPDDVASDPIWTNRKRMTGRYGGTKENDNYLVFNEAIQCYVEMDDDWTAIVLSITYGELMCRETVSFQERYGFDKKQYIPNLRALIQRVGGSSRDL